MNLYWGIIICIIIYAYLFGVIVSLTKPVFEVTIFGKKIKRGWTAAFWPIKVAILLVIEMVMWIIGVTILLFDSTIKLIRNRKV